MNGIQWCRILRSLGFLLAAALLLAGTSRPAAAQQYQEDVESYCWVDADGYQDCIEGTLQLEIYETNGQAEVDAYGETWVDYDFMWNLIDSYVTIDLYQAGQLIRGDGEQACGPSTVAIDTWEDLPLLYQYSLAGTHTVDYQDDCGMGYGEGPCEWMDEVDTYVTLFAGDPTPYIESITSPWPTGQDTYVTITGNGFGTNPTVTLSDSSISISSLSGSDTQVTFYANVPATDTNTSVQVTVTSQGFNGSGFIASYPGQSSSGQNNAQVTTTEGVQVTSVQVSPTSITSTSTDATVSVQVHHDDSGNLTNPTATLTISTNSQYPTGNDVDYLGQTVWQNINLKGPAGLIEPAYTVTVRWKQNVTVAGSGGACPPITNGSACVVIEGKLTNASAGVVINSPSPASNGIAVLNTTH